MPCRMSLQEKVTRKKALFLVGARLIQTITMVRAMCAQPGKSSNAGSPHAHGHEGSPGSMQNLAGKRMLPASSITMSTCHVSC